MTSTDNTFSTLSVAALRSWAKEHNVKIPGNCRKKDDIVLLLSSSTQSLKEENPADVPNLIDGVPRASHDTRTGASSLEALLPTQNTGTRKKRGSSGVEAKSDLEIPSPSLIEAQDLGGLSLVNIRLQAKSRGIKIPGEYRKKEEIVKYLQEQITNTSAAEIVINLRSKSPATASKAKSPTTASRAKSPTVRLTVQSEANDEADDGEENIVVDLSKITISVLKEIAKEYRVKIPAAKKKKGDIVIFLQEALKGKKIVLPTKQVVSDVSNPADLAELTGDELRSYAKEKKIKVPAELTRKMDRIKYITAVLEERNAGIVRPSHHLVDDTAILPVECDLSGYEQRSLKTGNPSWLYHLYDKGWSVVPLDGLSVGPCQDRFYDWLGRHSSSSFSRADPKTWTDLPCSLRDGIIRQNFGHTDLQWEVRERCVSAFSTIWRVKPEDLLCSFDGGCFLPPREKSKKVKLWLHTDQHNGIVDFSCVQGLVTLSNCGPEDGGLVLVQGSKEIFASYRQRHPSEGYGYCLVDMEDPDVKGLQIIKPCVPAGSLILWDSRMIHCNLAPTTADPRICLYVSMGRRSDATPDELSKRVKWYTEGKMTTHSVSGPWLHVVKKPWRQGDKTDPQPEVVEKSPLNQLRARLVGYESLPTL